MPAPAPSAPAQGSASQPGQRISLFWFWILAAALLLAGLYITHRARQLQQELAQLETQYAAAHEDRREIQRSLEETRQTTLILNDPASRRIALLPTPASPHRAVPPLHAWWHPKLGLVVAGVNIPLPAGDRELRVWLLTADPGGNMLPAGTLRPHPDGTLLLLYVENPPASIEATKSILVTEEPAGAGAAPTSSPLWSGSPR
ncbi:MAG: anti-sigma factor [Acidobacteriia bacterium]|nr:anti-sigma factor [Terriglobia bacterium]